MTAIKQVKYPNVSCDNNFHEVAPGYIVCTHVSEEGVAVDRVEPPKPDDLGQILCADGDHEDADQAVLYCAGCAADRGWVDSLQ